MVENPIPLIAELNDCHNCIQQGIAGIQLSEETAIGKNIPNVLDCLAGLVESTFRRNNIVLQG
jgi:pyruvate kinase